MRITFVDNLLYENSYSIRKSDLQPHLGLISLAAVARTADHHVTVYDPKLEVYSGRLSLDESLYRDIARDILAATPDVVGFTALGCNFHCVVKVAQRLKRLEPDLPIVLGGPHATILHRELLERFSAFDVIVRSEAEDTINPLLASVSARQFGDLPGISYRDGRRGIVSTEDGPVIENLDRLPIPAYDCYPLAELGVATIRVEAGRGCPFSCTFCSTASFFGRLYRLKSTARLIAELDYLHDTYHCSDFKLTHDLFTVNAKKVAEFCEAVASRGYTWSCSARVDCVDEPLLRRMHDAGCRDIYFGVETGSARMQEISRKRLDVQLVQPVLDVTAALGIKTTTSFIVGYPEETAGDQDETLDLMGRLFCRPAGMNALQIHLLTPEPGTDLIARYGDKLLFDAHISDFNFPMLAGDDRALIEKCPKIFSTHHYFPSIVARERNIFITSAWIVLWEAGAAFMAHLLPAFGHRLSHFMAEAVGWYARASPARWNVGVRDIEQFLTARFGPNHRLVSLFRYAYTAATIQRTSRISISELSQDGDPRDLALWLGPGAAVLREIHANVARMSGVPGSITDECVAEAADDSLRHLLLVGHGGAKQFVSVYVIDNITADLLERFEEPKSYWEYCREIVDGDDRAPLPDWSQLALLHGMGALEFHPAAVQLAVNGAGPHS